MRLIGRRMNGAATSIEAADTNTKKSKRSWKRFFRKKTPDAEVVENVGEGPEVNVLDDSELQVSESADTSDPVENTVLLADEDSDDDEDSVYQAHAEKVRMTELDLQRNLEEMNRDLSMNSRRKGTGDDLPMMLMTTSGVMVFEGMNQLEDEIADDDSVHEVIVEEMKKKEMVEDKKQAQRGLSFIEAPKNYDPVGSGFYRPNKDKAKSFYDDSSDEE